MTTASVCMYAPTVKLSSEGSCVCMYERLDVLDIWHTSVVRTYVTYVPPKFVWIFYLTNKRVRIFSDLIGDGKGEYFPVICHKEHTFLTAAITTDP